MCDGGCGRSRQPSAGSSERRGARSKGQRRTTFARWSQISSPLFLASGLLVFPPSFPADPCLLYSLLSLLCSFSPSTLLFDFSQISTYHFSSHPGRGTPDFFPHSAHQVVVRPLRFPVLLLSIARASLLLCGGRQFIREDERV